MPIQITMPRLSDTMEEGTLVKWHVNVGDDVAAGDHLADVETDKATMELQAFDDGKVAKMAIDEGSTVPVGELIMVLAGQGESTEEAAKAAAPAKPNAAEKPHAKKPEKEKPQSASQQAPAAQPPAGTPLRASPLARKLAEEKGLDLNQIQGTGPSGRIIKKDVLKAAQAGPAPQPAAVQGPSAPPVGPVALQAKSLALSNMRKTIAKRLVESKTTVPHFTVSVAINMDPLLELRKTLNDQLASQNVKLSVNDFITRAAALACAQHPTVNSSWNESTIEQHGTVNIGIAVALPEERGGGLIVPVLRDVQNLGLRAISQQTKTLAKKARETGLSAQEMEGGTFTISNLGMFGVDHFEAIINPPQAAILAVGAANEKPVVRQGQLTIGHEMLATLSGDHRVIDGAIGAQYLQSLKSLLENPAGLLV